MWLQSCFSALTVGVHGLDLLGVVAVGQFLLERPVPADGLCRRRVDHLLGRGAVLLLQPLEPLSDDVRRDSGERNCKVDVLVVF